MPDKDGKLTTSEGYTRVVCNHCRLNVTLMALEGNGKKCPRCRCGLFTDNKYVAGNELRMAPRDKSAATPPNRQRGNFLPQRVQ